MPEKTMTHKELVDLIAKHSTDDVAALVKTSIDTAMEPIKASQTDWMEKMLTGTAAGLRNGTKSPDYA